ncbi:PIG-L deacetylase family protein [Brachybacterium phenoliresistens]|uniref:PIG-L deacetylase family protein n=1 Tax=Brachybacterium phenoliresistens TaxID=396014 RepID=UPI0031CE6AB4
MPIALLLHAHPDDEAFANFGWASDLVAQGYDVHGVIATGGEASELRSTSSLREARARRIAKYETALDVMGASGWSWLDSSAAWVDADGGPLVGDASPERLRQAVERLLEQVRPEIVLTFASDGLTGHPDHIAIAEAAVAAENGAAVPGGVWGARLAEPDVRAGVDLLRVLAPSARIGSGRVRGTCTELITRNVQASAQNRKRALDAYHEGLGTGSLESLVRGGEVVGDSILLRGILEATGWSTERYEVIRADHARQPLPGPTA